MSFAYYIFSKNNSTEQIPFQKQLLQTRVFLLQLNPALTFFFLGHPGAGRGVVGGPPGRAERGGGEPGPAGGRGGGGLRGVVLPPGSPCHPPTVELLRFGGSAEKIGSVQSGKTLLLV